VRDNRNLLLLQPTWQMDDPQRFLTTLAYALQRAIQFEYQVEESEVAVEIIGEGDQQRLLFWEAAEGGTGVWERILADAGSLADLARSALTVCHFDPDTGAPVDGWDEKCAMGCYDCLLSYSNQRFHKSIDRHSIHDFLMELGHSRLSQESEGGSYDEKFRRLLGLVDPQSALERQFLTYLHDHDLRLPDTAQHRPDPNVPVQPDFYYDRDGLPGVCVFIHGSVHDQDRQVERDMSLREALEDHGHRVVTIRHDEGLDGQIEKHHDLFRPVR
jgi:hypothetical protein